VTTCPKCRQTSGNSWSQCDGACPMPMSPHFAPVTNRPKVGERGEFHVYAEGKVVEVYLGPAHDPESEYVLALHTDYIPALIAALRLAQDRGGK
jgi:hypothetical protein